MNRFDPLSKDAQTQLLHARARAQDADRAASRMEAQAREARARAAAAYRHYENLLLEHGGQMTIDDMEESESS